MAIATPTIHESRSAFAGTYKLKSAKLWMAIAASAPVHPKPRSREFQSSLNAARTVFINTIRNSPPKIKKPTTPSSLLTGCNHCEQTCNSNPRWQSDT